MLSRALQDGLCPAGLDGAVISRIEMAALLAALPHCRAGLRLRPFLASSAAVGDSGASGEPERGLEL
jgi:hypothetical protein